MERLTSKKEADAQRKSYERRLKQGYPRSIPEERFLKLAAYEDTGLEPGEITDFLPTLKDWRQNMGALRHAHELVTAESEGRLLVLPCKVGDTVYLNIAMSGWYLRSRDRPYSAKVVFIGINADDGMGGGLINVTYDKGDYMTQFCFSDFGKTVFRTREEAEEAMEQEGE